MIGSTNRHRKGFTLMEMMVVTALFALTVTLSSVMFIRTTREGTRAKNIQTVQGDVRYVMEKISQDVQMGTIDYGYYRNPGSAKDANKNEPWRDMVTQRVLLDRTGSKSGGQPIDRIGILALRDGFYNQIFYAWNESDATIETCTNVYGGEQSIDTAFCASSNHWTRLTPSRSLIKKLEFIVSPAADPFFQPVDGTACKNPLTWDASVGRCRCNNGGAPDPSQCWIGEGCEQTTTPSGVDFFCQAPDEQPSATIVMEAVSAELGESETEERIRLQSTIASRRYLR